MPDRGGRQRNYEIGGLRFLVMAGLVPAIHVFELLQNSKAWMPATSAGMTNVA
jgi:hypothetical protein